MKEMKPTLIVFLITTVGAFVGPPLLESINPSLVFNPLHIENVSLNGAKKPPNKTSPAPPGNPNSHRKFLEFPKSEYVDKTLFIRDALATFIDYPDLEKKPSILITRPRGFGKTLALSSLYYFCDYSFQNATRLFSELDIMSEYTDSDHVREKYMSKFPVIWIDFGTVIYETLEQNLKEIKLIISNIFREYQYLLESDKLSPDVKKRFQNFLGQSEEYSSIKSSITFLGECIHKYNKKVPIILIDNYDVPFHTGYKYNYCREIEEFMWSFYHSTIQENSFVHRVFLTGVMQIHDHSFYILENMHVHTVLDAKFAEHFGFTGEEVRQLLEWSDNNIRFQTLEYQYGGYLFGNFTIFNPLSVVNEIVLRKSCKWTQTEPKEPGKIIAEHGFFPILKILSLVWGERIRRNLADYVYFPDLENRELAYWTYLVHSGYVTVSQVWLSIPNYEVRKQIENSINKTIAEYKTVTDQLILGDYKNAKYFFHKYIQGAGKYFWDSDGLKDKLVGYVQLMLRGVENRFHTKMKVFSNRWGQNMTITSNRAGTAPVKVCVRKFNEYMHRNSSIGEITDKILLEIDGKDIYLRGGPGADVLLCSAHREKTQPKETGTDT